LIDKKNFIILIPGYLPGPVTGTGFIGLTWWILKWELSRISYRQFEKSQR